MIPIANEPKTLYIYKLTWILATLSCSNGLTKSAVGSSNNSVDNSNKTRPRYATPCPLPKFNASYLSGRSLYSLGEP